MYLLKLYKCIDTEILFISCVTILIWSAFQNPLTIFTSIKYQLVKIVLVKGYVHALATLADADIP